MPGQAKVVLVRVLVRVLVVLWGEEEEWRKTCTLNQFHSGSSACRVEVQCTSTQNHWGTI